MPDLNRLRRDRRGWITMAAAAGSRAAIGLVFVALVTTSLEPRDTRNILQLLFLQGGLTALFSASAYARGAALASGSLDMRPLFRRFAAFLALSSVVAVAVGAVTVAPPGAAWIIVVGAFVAGAAGAAVSGLLQGVLVVRMGGSAAFLPTVVVNAGGIGAMLSCWGTVGPVGATLLWIAPQVLSPVLLLSRGARRLTGSERARAGNAFAAVGVLNGGSVAIAYEFRERWADHQSVGNAATAFAVVRVTELAYQILYMILASMPRRIDRHFVVPLGRSRGVLLLLVVGVVAVAFGGWLALSAEEWQLSTFITAEVAVLPARLITMLCLLAMLARATTRAYLATMAATLVVTSAALALPGLQASPYGLQAFQALAAATAIAGAAITFRPRAAQAAKVPE